MITGSDNLKSIIGQVPMDINVYGAPHHIAEAGPGDYAVVDDVCTLSVVEEAIKRGVRVFSLDDIKMESLTWSQQQETPGATLNITAQNFDASTVAERDSQSDSSVKNAPRPVLANRNQVRLSNAIAQRGRVISCFSSKGGVGKSTTAVNLGIGYALQGHRTILIDLDIGDGDAPEKIGIKSTASPNIENWSDFHDFIPIKHGSGLFVLPHGGNPNLVIDEAYLRELILTLSLQFDVVALDYGVRPFHQHTLAGMELSDEVYVITDLDEDWIPQFAERFRRERGDWISSGKARLVINKVCPGKYYRPADVGQIMGFKSWYEVPYRPSEFVAASRADKGVIQLAGSNAGQAFANIVGGLPEKSAGFLSRFIRR